MAFFYQQRGYKLNIQYTHPLHDQRDRLCGLFNSQRAGDCTLLNLRTAYSQSSAGSRSFAFQFLFHRPPSLVEVVRI